MSFTHSHSWTIPAAPANVFRALTDPVELTKWFAEGAQVEPREGGVYRFWGRHTLGTPPHDAARQVITKLVPDALLAFDWPINDVATDVSITLVPAAEGTTLSLAHRVSGDLGLPRQRELIDDHWRLAFGNLMAHLEGGTGVSLPDYFNPNPEVRITMTIGAPRAVVFRALIDPARVNRWIGSTSAEIEPHTGGCYTLGWTSRVNGTDVASGPTHIIELIADTKLVLDWPDARGDALVARQTITFQLAPNSQGGTTLTFVHAGFMRTTDLGDYGFGWRRVLRELATEVQREVP